MAAKMFIRPVRGRVQERVEVDEKYIERRNKFPVPVELRGTRKEIKALLFKYPLKSFVSDSKSPLYYRVQDYTPVTKKHYKPVKVGTAGVALIGLLMKAGKLAKSAATGFTVELEVTDVKIDKSKETAKSELHFSEFLKIV
jgi:hypothetical protein